MAEYEDEPDEGEEQLEQIIENGELVFFHSWESGGPGAGAGSERIYRLGDQYVFASEDFGNSGPFESLEDALSVIDLFFVNSATREIESTELSEQELLQRIHIEFEDPDYPIQFLLNGKPYRYEFDKAKLVPLTPKHDGS